MSKKAIRIAALLAIALLAALFFLFQDDILAGDQPQSPSAELSTSSPTAQAPPEIPVEAIITRAESLLEAISVNGSTVPNEEVSISSEVAGKILKINFQEGDYVKKGAVLVQLDDDELQAERKRLVVQKQLDEKIAERLEGLYQKEGVSLQEYEVAVAEAEKTAADIALVDAQLEKRVVRAPFNGRLGLRMVSEGSYLAPGAPIVDLVSINPIKLEFDVPEKYSRVIQNRSRVHFRLDGQEETIQATVIAQEPNIDRETRTLRFKAMAPNPDGYILPGAFANVKVELEKYSGTIMVPTQAVVPELNDKKVFRYENGKAQPVIISTGIRQERNIQVIEGLSIGDTIITSGILQIRPGAPVRISTLN
ncbi:MAG: efflux RND transporter periplasmic adaptor subunit [Mameliella sp.]|nr:efflux RND transporter periplasmic adaptor subunit [Phaeodactylibacter sp.]